MPGVADSNSPAYWTKSGLYLFNSVAMPVRAEGYDQFTLGAVRSVLFDVYDTHLFRWIESAWTDDSGTIFAFYHNEPGVVCEDAPLTAPQIGAMYSLDNGNSFFDLGIVLTNGRPYDCTSRNGYFAGGNGDFSVIVDRAREYVYFVYSNYGGYVTEQGIAIARMPYERRHSPVGAVRKYYHGRWTEPGIGGRVAPIFSATVSWAAENTDSFWGPSIHWNTYLERYVMLMNRSCCQPLWPAEGIYMTTTADLASPQNWTAPVRLLANAGWYPQVLGLEAGETDSLAGQVARLYVGGESHWEIEFVKDPVDAAGMIPAPEPVASGQRLFRKPRPSARNYGLSPGRLNLTR